MWLLVKGHTRPYHSRGTLAWTKWPHRCVAEWWRRWDDVTFVGLIPCTVGIMNYKPFSQPHFHLFHRCLKNWKLLSIKQPLYSRSTSGGLELTPSWIVKQLHNKPECFKTILRTVLASVTEQGQYFIQEIWILSTSKQWISSDRKSLFSTKHVLKIYFKLVFRWNL